MLRQNDSATRDPGGRKGEDGGYLWMEGAASMETDLAHPKLGRPAAKETWRRLHIYI